MKKRRSLSGSKNTIIERNTMVAINEVNDKTRILKAMQNVRILKIVRFRVIECKRKKKKYKNKNIRLITTFS